MKFGTKAHNIISRRQLRCSITLAERSFHCSIKTIFGKTVTCTLASYEIILELLTINLVIVVDRVNILLLFSLIAMQNLVAVCHTVGRKGLKTLILVCWGPSTWDRWCGWSSRNISLLTCYRANLVTLGQTAWQFVKYEKAETSALLG